MNDGTKICVYIDSCMIGGMHKQMLLLLRYLPKSYKKYLIVQHFTGGLKSEFEEEADFISNLNWRGKWDFINTVLKLRKQLLKIKPDVIIITEAQNFVYYLLCYLTMPFSMPKLIGSFRALTFWKGHLGPFKRIIDDIVSLIFILVSKVVVVNSYAMRENYENKFGNRNKFQVIHNVFIKTGSPALNLNLFNSIQLLRKENYTILMHVARFDPWKDFDTLLEALAHLKRATYKVKLFLIGDGSDREKIINKIIKLDVKDQVILVGEINNVESILPLTDISILSTHGEGLSNSIIESIALKVPIVATDVGGNRELILNKRFLTRHGDSISLYNTLIYLIDNPTIRDASILENFNNLILKTSPETYVKQWSIAIQKVISS